MRFHTEASWYRRLFHGSTAYQRSVPAPHPVPTHPLWRRKHRSVVVSAETMHDQLYIVGAISQLTEPRHHETLAFDPAAHFIAKPQHTQAEAIKLSELQAIRRGASPEYLG